MKTFILLVAAQAAAVAASFSLAPASGAFSPSSARSTKTTTTTTSRNLSPSSVGGLLLRGGAASAELKSYYGDALGFFGGIRIPSSFLAGTSLAAIFTLKGAADNLSATSNEDGSNGEELTTLEKRLIKVYHLASLLAFLLSLNTLMTAQTAYTSILHGRFDDMAETAYMLMRREFEYEFVSCRWSFLTSIFCFLGMVTSRVLIEFGLCKEGNNETRKDVARLAICSFGALAAHLLSYVNQTLWCWNSLLDMTASLAQLVFKRAFVDRKPLQLVSVSLTLVSSFYVAKLAVQDLRGEAKSK